MMARRGERNEEGNNDWGKFHAETSNETVWTVLFQLLERGGRGPIFEGGRDGIRGAIGDNRKSVKSSRFGIREMALMEEKGGI